MVNEGIVLGHKISERGEEPSARSVIAKAVPPFSNLTKRVGARATATQVARTHLLVSSKGHMTTCHTSSYPIPVLKFVHYST